MVSGGAKSPRKTQICKTCKKELPTKEFITRQKKMKICKQCRSEQGIKNNSKRRCYGNV